MSKITLLVYLVITPISLYINYTTYLFFTKMMRRFNFHTTPLFQDYDLWITSIDVKIVGLFILLALLSTFILPPTDILRLRWLTIPMALTLLIFSPLYTPPKAVSAAVVYLSSLFMLFLLKKIWLWEKLCVSDALILLTHVTVLVELRSRYVVFFTSYLVLAALELLALLFRK